MTGDPGQLFQLRGCRYSSPPALSGTGITQRLPGFVTRCPSGSRTSQTASSSACWPNTNQLV